MRNVFKGFQTSHLAVPKVHVAKINQQFNAHHAPSLHRPALKIEKQQSVKRVPMIGRNTRGKW